MKDIERRIAALSPVQLSALFERLAKAPSRVPTSPALARRRRDSPLRPLSFAQESLWVLDQLSPGTGDYNVASALRLRGPARLGVFEQALREIARRHEVLRAGFGAMAGRPLQTVEDDPPWMAARIDLSSLSPEDRAAEARRLAGRQAEHAFDLARPPLLRVGWIRLAADEHVLVVTLHHIVCDGWSIGIVTGELGEIHQAFAAGRPSSLGEMAVQYADYADWQRETLQGERSVRHQEYWRRQLRGASPAIGLRGQPPEGLAGVGGEEVRRVGEEVFALGQEATRVLLALAREERATPFMLLAALFAAALHCESAQDDLCLGANVAQRAAFELEALIGFFVNQVVLRIRLDRSASFRDLLGRVRETVGDAHAHGDLPFERLVEMLGRERAGASPFQAKVDFIDAPAPLALPGLELFPLDLGAPPLRCDLLLMGWHQDGELSCSLSYDRARVGAGKAGRLAANFRFLSEVVADEASLPLHELATRVSREEARRLAAEREQLDRLGAARLQGARRRGVRV